MLFFRKKRAPKAPLEPVIEVFVRHTPFSPASNHKKRPAFFDKERCYQNLIATADERVRLTHILDTAHGKDHFLSGQGVEIKGGTEAQSFLALIDYVSSLKLQPNTLIYFVEDDYMHRNGWVDVLFEAFELPIDYATLYDHSDKYKVYPKLFSKIFVSPSCHWRTSPSTTNTYAMRFSTFQEDFWIHRRFSLARKVTADHDKFCFLRRKGRVLVSSMPGWSTHADPEHLSPCIDWEPYFKGSGLCKH